MIMIIITVHRTIIKSLQSIFWNIPVGVFVNFMRQCALGHIFLDTQFTEGLKDIDKDKDLQNIKETTLSLQKQ